jgi:hypothetical protein
MRFVACDPEPILMLERLEDLVHGVVSVPMPEQKEQNPDHRNLIWFGGWLP